MRLTILQTTGCSINLLVSSSGSTLPVVLSMPNTADFCVLTARSLYSFYPDTTGRRVNLFSEICSGRPSTIKYMVGLRSYETTANWLEPCGEACPAVFRLTRRLKGVSVMRLTDGKKGEPDDFDPEGTFGRGCYMWRLGTSCENPMCPNYNRLVLLSVRDNTWAY